MSVNIKKPLNLFISLLLPVLCQGQILISDLLNLNAGGVVYDVAYDQVYNGYYIVGNFTTVNGSPRKNICFLNESDFTVSAASYVNPITAMDGEIRTIAIKFVWNPLFSNWDRHIFLGGNFSTLTLQSGGPQSRIGFAKASANAAPLSNFTLAPLNADFDIAPLGSPGVNDIEAYGDTVLIAGEFLVVNNSTSMDYRDGFVAYKFSDNSLMTYPAISASGSGQRRWMDVERIDGEMFITGDLDIGGASDGKLYKLTSAGAINASFNFVATNPSNCGYRINAIDDSLIVYLDDWNAVENAGERIHLIRASNGTYKTDHDFSEDGSGVIGGVGGSKRSLDVYKNFLYTSTSNAGTSVISFEGLGSGPVSAPNWNANAVVALTANWFGHIHRSRNVMFVSAPNLTTLSGSARQRLGAYCLEPPNPVNYTTFDSTVCPGQIATYTVPQVSYAEGYVWQYTGNGADIDLTGAPENLYCVKSVTTGNTIQVEFTDLFSAGQLRVRAYSRCGGNLVTTDTLFSEYLPINIWSNPLPNAIAGTDTSLTCIVSSVLLSGSTDSASCSLEWLNPGPFGNTIGPDTLATTNNDYILKVINSSGCYNYDTITVSIDTLSPDLIVPPGPFELTCSDSVLTLLGSTSVIDSTTWWKIVTTGSPVPNPININLPGNYRYLVLNNENGCVDSTEIVVTINQPSPNIKVMGYPDLIPAVPLDTVTCSLDTLYLTSYSDSLNAISDWTTADTSSLLGNYLEIVAGGNYYILVTDTITGCTNFTTVIISQFTNPPDVIVPPSGLLNCSFDSLVLDGSSTISASALEWTGSPIPPSADPLTVNSPSTYYLSVTRDDNGCSATDSVIVTEDLTITVSAGNDTLVCDGSFVPVFGSFIGTIGGIGYLWNNGATTVGTSFTAGTDSVAIIEVSGAGGCFGSDTLLIGIPPVPVIDIEPFAPCGDANSGQLVITPVSGMDPFLYSIDGGTSTQSSTVFAGLPMGTYTVTVFDSLNCFYNFSATIDQSSSLPTPDFLVSTYNHQTDTIVLVNVSTPPPDSVQWVIPAPLILLSSNQNYATVILPDTGTFVLEMIAWFGSCQSTVSKTIDAEFPDSSAATPSNANGIKSAVLFPNPSSGSFTAEVVFYKSQRCAMLISDMAGYDYGQVHFDEEETVSHYFELNASVVNGTYVLHIVSEFDAAHLMFVLNR